VRLFGLVELDEEKTAKRRVDLRLDLGRGMRRAKLLDPLDVVSRLGVAKLRARRSSARGKRTCSMSGACLPFCARYWR
jgi:hypothetical protein